MNSFDTQRSLEQTAGKDRDFAPAPQGIVVADTQWLVRIGLASVIDKIAGCQVAGMADSGAEAIRLAQTLKPSLLLLGVGISAPGCMDVIRSVRESVPSLKVLVLSQPGAELDARAALRAGCNGFIDRDHNGETLERAIREVIAGGTFLDPEVSRKLLLATEEPAAAPTELATLTQRERAVFIHIASGHTNRSAGKALHISPKTVEKHRALVMRKLNLRSAVDLRFLAVDLGLIARPTHDQAQARGAA